MHRYKLITFDITGTILKFKHPPGVHYANTSALFGIQADPEKLTTSFGRQWKYLNNTKPNFGLQHYGWEQWWNEIVRLTFIDAGIKCEKQILDTIADQLIEHYTTPACWEHCDGAIDLLSYLAKCNITVGVISNFDSRLETILDNLNVRTYFDFVVTSYESGHMKPDPRIFREALKRSSCRVQKPTEILHVGDTKDLDYNGAILAGWNSWLVVPSSSTMHCDIFSGNLHQLQLHLRSRNQNAG